VIMQMKFQCAVLILSLAVSSFAAWVFGQEQEVLPLEAEPHHHLALKNAYVKVYRVEVAP